MREKRRRKPGKSSANPWPARLVAIRDRLGLTQLQLADRLGIPVATLRNWEQGRTLPRGAAARLIDVVFPK